MPQGHKNSANVWSKIISEIFGPLKYEPLLVYQDDQINHEQDLIKHLLLQGKVYHILQEYNMIHKWQKTNLNYRTMKILGHVLSRQGRGPDPGLIRTIDDLARPRTLTDLRCFLGLCRVAQEYISNLAGILQPMSDLTKKGRNVDLDWGPEQQAAFEKIKILMTSKPVLMEPKYNQQFRIHCDACRVGHGLGAVLLQKNKEDKWQIVAYWSRGLDAAERHSSATMLECIALHDAIQHWGHFLQNGIIFQVVTDHYALVYLVTKCGASSCNNLRLQNYCLDIQQFHFELFHRAGKIHYDADAVSRLLHTGEEPYFNSADDVRDDFGPLTEEEKAYFLKQYDTQNSALIIEAINNHRLERERELLVNPPPPKLDLPSISAQNSLEAQISSLRIKLIEDEDMEKIRTKESCLQISKLMNIRIEVPERTYISSNESEWKQYPTDELIRLWPTITDLYKRWRIMKELARRNPNTAKDFKEKVRKEQEWKEELVAEDGNSFFRCLSLQIYGTQDRHMELRLLCVTYLKLHRKRFEHYFEGDFEGHCSRLLSKNSEVGALDIRVMEEVLDRYIKIFSVSKDIADKISYTEKNGLEKFRLGEERKDYSPDITIVIKDDHHFDSITPIETLGCRDQDYKPFPLAVPSYIKKMRIGAFIKEHSPDIDAIDVLVAPELFDYQERLQRKQKQYRDRTEKQLLSTLQSKAVRELARVLEDNEDQEDSINQLKSISDRNNILWERVEMRKDLNKEIASICSNNVSTEKAAKVQAQELRRSNRVAFNKGRKDLKTAEQLAESREAAAIKKRKEKESRWSQKVIKETSKDPIRREAQRSEEYHSNLENYDYLVAKHYVDPITKALYEIITVYYDRKQKVFMSVSRLVDDTEIGIIENIEDIGGLQIIPILGPNGT